MRLNKRDSEGKYLVSNDEHDVSNHDTARRVDEERPALFGDTDAETEATEMADIVIINDGEAEELRDALELLLRPDES